MRRGTASLSRLGGWAVDGGLKKTWARTWTPTVTLGYAFGSGDRTAGDGRDTRFRQTGLEDNRAYYGGLRRLAIYGELFDPELSNLHVVTAGLGMRPRRGVAFDAVYHHFVQAHAAQQLPSSNLQGKANGLQRTLGDELNLVLTVRAARGIDVDLAAGTFLAGSALSGTAPPAFFWRPQVRFFF
jgi:hypothetical protein